MRTARVPPPLRWILSIAVVLVIATMPLTWVPLARIAGFELQLPYAAALGLGALVLLFPAPLSQALRNLPPAVVLWLSAYVAYLVLLQIGLSGGESKGMVLRQVFFLTCGCAFALGLAATGADSRVLRAGGALAIVGFLALSEMLAWQLGLSWVTVLNTLATTGNFDFVFYQFLKRMFELVLPAGAEAQASDKNAVSVALLMALFLFRSGWHGTAQDRAGQLLTLLTLGVLAVLNTRSVLMLAVVCLPLAGWIAAVRDGIRDTGAFILKTVLFGGLMLAGLVLLSMHPGATGAMGDRFAFDDDSTGKRFEQYSWALERIEANPWFGSGLGEYKGQPVHNLFLGAWMHAGVFAFLLVLVAYLAMALSWLVFLVRVVAQRGHWVLPLRAEWVAMLPLLPLFRMWIAGDAGHPSFVEWLTLCAFFAMLVTNRIVRSARPPAAAARPSHHAPPLGLGAAG